MQTGMQVSLGWRHVVGLDMAGRVWAWGCNCFGQCGQPPDSHPLLTAPMLTCLDTHAKWVSAGSEHSAAVAADGSVYMWGWGEHGQIGIGSEVDVWQPTCVDLPACVQIVCGSGYTIAVKA